MLSWIKKNTFKIMLMALFTYSVSFAQSGLEVGLFIPLGASISLHQYDRDYFKNDMDAEKYASNNMRKTFVGFEFGFLAQVGYRFAMGKSSSFSLLAELGYNRDVFNYAKADTDTNSSILKLKNFQEHVFDNFVIGLLPKFNFGKISIGVGGGVKLPLYAYINSASYNPALGYVDEEIVLINTKKISDYFETPLIPYVKLVYDHSIYSSESVDLVLSGYVNYDFAINYTNKTVEKFGPKQSLSAVDVGIQLGAKIKPMTGKGKK